MNEKPILMSTPMVQAILAGKKTMTRRVVQARTPYQVGDRLWVRETWQHNPFGGIVYKAGSGIVNCDGRGWRPSIFMPRWASRITLEITNVRVERLQEITEADARSEGAQPALWFQPTKNEDDDYSLSPSGKISYKNGFANIWQLINGKKYPWANNPWVWVIEFKVLEGK